MATKKKSTKKAVKVKQAPLKVVPPEKPMDPLLERSKPILDQIFGGAITDKGKLNERTLLYHLVSHVAIHIMKLNEMEQSIKMMMDHIAKKKPEGEAVNATA